MRSCDDQGVFERQFVRPEGQGSIALQKMGIESSKPFYSGMMGALSYYNLCKVNGYQ